MERRKAALALIYLAVALQARAGVAENPHEEPKRLLTARITHRGRLRGNSDPAKRLDREAVFAGEGPSHEERGLPESCLSYEQRYKQQYHSGLRHSYAANTLNLHSRFAVVMLLHYMPKTSVSHDMILNLRAAAAEVTQAGYHFYILCQIPTHDFFMIGGNEIETRLNREEMLDFLPFDLRPFVILHDFEHELSAYPLGKGDDQYNVHPAILWGPGPRASYVAMLAFMRRYQAYEYAWVMEYDARYLGSSWGKFFNAALDLARQATAEEVNAEPGRIIRTDRIASRDLPSNYDGLPDLLAMSGIIETDKWKNNVHNMKNATIMWEMTTMVYMGSRRLWEAVHEAAVANIGAHSEVCLSTIAMQRGMKAVSLPALVDPDYPAAWHCCGKEAATLYGRWHNDSGRCTSARLVHPVKADEPYWPREEAVALP